MTNYYAKLVGSFPVHAFTSKSDRSYWMKWSKSVTEAIVAKQARECAERDGWMICHYPAKPSPFWDDEAHIWYPSNAVDDGFGFDYTSEIEWHRYEQ